MDFVDRIVGHDIWFTRRLLDSAAELPDEALDRPIVAMWGTRDENRASLRALLNALVANKENWSAALSGCAAPEDGGTSLDDLKRRLEVAGSECLRLICGSRDRGDWDAGFVDALCDPPESFTYGGMLAHVATFSAYRRTQAVLALRDLGVGDIGIGDPIEWERSLA